MTTSVVRTKVPLYTAIASKVAWKPTESFRVQRDHELRMLVRMLPSGSGWDMGTKIDEKASRPCRLVFYGGFHHMNEHGFYDGWTDHRIVVTPSLVSEIEIRITGRDRKQIKDHLHEMFDFALRELVWEWDFATHGGFVVDGREDGQPNEVVWNEASGVWDVFTYETGPATRLYSTQGR